MAPNPKKPKDKKQVGTKSALPVVLPVDALRQLAAMVVALQAKARALGLFPNDRELLECARCGLMEDVAVDGRLFTCRPEALDTDKGLRFEQLSGDLFRCPGCGGTVREPGGD